MKQHWKKALALLCVCALCASLLSFGAFADETGGENAWGDVAQDNFVRVSSAEALSAGQLQDVEVTEEVGDGAVRLAGGAQEGRGTRQNGSTAGSGRRGPGQRSGPGPGWQRGHHHVRRRSGSPETSAATSIGSASTGRRSTSS